MTGRAEAGDRELDAKIAERLFGEDMSPVQHADMFQKMATAERPGIIICLRCDATWTRVEDISGTCPWGRAPDRYSSTGDGMLRVVEQMRAKGFMVRIENDSTPRGDVTTNTIEGAFGLLKRGVYGIWHSVSPDYLPLYLNDVEFRYNTRKMEDGERVAALMRECEGKRLTYRPA